ncbi:hypothetical protein LN042_34285 [Kitasatospora sp. RB6PN24]|uniref:hypothetical protein n=1 Tax=Kitasatospora humi TaxID=2893891 RepID=UPI001E558B55|nr:hypothetical protein [Kitasatospora humi]MCC9312071.1 hypothetical protein [Kitasatospora humi]
MPTTRTTTVEALALFATLLATFDALHPACDHWVQDSRSARCKRLYGDHLVYPDGTPVEGEHRTGEPVLTASQLGRRAAWKHVGSYSAVQLGASLAIGRALGYRIPLPALLAGTAINGLTHAALDRGAFLQWLADKTGKTGYLQHCTAARVGEDGTVTAELTGPGSAWLELDSAAHKAIGVAAAALTTWLATRRLAGGAA